MSPHAVPTGPWPDRVTIRDVGPRDGLQPEEPVPVAERVRLVHALADAGVTRIEVTAFVSPRAVPAMAGAAEVVAALDRRPGVTYAALVPNLRGAEAALEAGVDELTVTISASETYNRRNVRMSTDQSADVIAAVVAAAGAVPVDAVVSCAFGSPYEGEIAPDEVVALARRLAGGGVARLTFADTTGMATPRRLADLAAALAEAPPTGPPPAGAPSAPGSGPSGDRVAPGPAPALARDLGLHLHDTRGTALVNAYAALGLGFARFDTAVGGVGGSPFAHGAGGNLATEELVALLDDLGIATGIAVEALVDAALLVEELIGRPVPSGVAHAGPRSRRSPSS